MRQFKAEDDEDLTGRDGVTVGAAVVAAEPVCPVPEGDLRNGCSGREASRSRPHVADNAVRGFTFAPTTLYRRQQFDRQGVREPPRHLFLCGEDVRVRAQALEGVCPEVSLVADLDELGVHTHALIRATHATFQDVDRKSTRLNSSHRTISYAVFCLKKK